MRTESTRWASVALLTMAGVWLLQLGCGPCFPNRLLLLGDDVLNRMQGREFKALVRELVPRSVGTLIALPDAGYGFTYQDSDDWSALVTAGVITEQALKDGTLRTFDSGKLPAEFRLYLDGRDAYERNDMAQARAFWQQLLDLPESERKHRTQRACYMMGRSYQKDDPAKAAEWFRRTREEAAKGFHDTLGLPNASLGWEARAEYDRMNMARAIELYMEQCAAGTPDVETSLVWSASRAMDLTDSGLDDLARSVMARKVMNAYLGTYASRSEWWLSDETKEARGPSFARRWAGALERAGAHDVDQAGELAWHAYGSAEYDLAERWCKLSSDRSMEANWVRSRLLARAGKFEEAAESLRRMVRDVPRNWLWRERFSCEGDMERPAEANLMGERGVLLLTSRHYADAMDSFLAGGFWEDAAWVGERVLSIEELEIYLKPKIASAKKEERQTVEALAWLLARRLARNGRYAEAMAYAPVTIRDQLVRMDHWSQKAADSRTSAADRATAFWEAAKILRWQGLEMAGTEFAPDFFVYEGQYEQDVKGSAYARENQQGVLRPTDDERARVAASASEPDLRFHYRYRACEMAWKAAELLPDGDPRTAEVLCEAGRWLGARDPKYADRFYKALVRRCGDTELGRRAAALKWFPPPDPKPS